VITFIAVVLLLVCLFLATVLGYVLYKAYHLAQTVLILEDDISDAIVAMNNAEETMNNLLNMQMFFDSPDVKKTVQDCLEDVKLTKFEINKIAQKFVERSKEKYIIEVIEEPDPDAPPPRTSQMMRIEP
jgi:hypothetical protein